jgi:acylphosphatase
MLVARRFLVSGRVQGVGFRYFAAEAAAAEGLGGWVRNLRDGRVEIMAEGDLESVERFARHLARGPAMARVEDVVQTDDVPSGRTGSFKIKGT